VDPLSDGRVVRSPPRSLMRLILTDALARAACFEGGTDVVFSSARSMVEVCPSVSEDKDRPCEEVSAQDRVVDDNRRDTRTLLYRKGGGLVGRCIKGGMPTGAHERAGGSHSARGLGRFAE